MLRKSGITGRQRIAKNIKTDDTPERRMGKKVHKDSKVRRHVKAISATRLISFSYIVF